MRAATSWASTPTPASRPKNDAIRNFISTAPRTGPTRRSFAEYQKDEAEKLLGESAPE